jgi:hypothetical protein
LGIGFFVYKSILLVVKVEFVVDRMSYIKLRSRWFHINLNVHVPTEDKADDVKD